MTFLLQDTIVADLDIIAIQELWQNFFYQVSFNPLGSEFYLIFTLSNYIKVCFYIN